MNIFGHPIRFTNEPLVPPGTKMALGPIGQFDRAPAADWPNYLFVGGPLHGKTFKVDPKRRYVDYGTRMDVELRRITYERRKYVAGASLIEVYVLTDVDEQQVDKYLRTMPTEKRFFVHPTVLAWLGQVADRIARGKMDNLIPIDSIAWPDRIDPHRLVQMPWMSFDAMPAIEFVSDPYIIWEERDLAWAIDAGLAKLPEPLGYIVAVPALACPVTIMAQYDTFFGFGIAENNLKRARSDSLRYLLGERFPPPSAERKKPSSSWPDRAVFAAMTDRKMGVMPMGMIAWSLPS